MKAIMSASVYEGMLFIFLDAPQNETPEFVMITPRLILTHAFEVFQGTHAYDLIDAHFGKDVRILSLQSPVLRSEYIIGVCSNNNQLANLIVEEAGKLMKKRKRPEPLPQLPTPSP
jgi:hypothetical protein